MSFTFGNNNLVILEDAKTGLFYRPDTGDLDVLKEMYEYKEIFKVCEDQVVMDVGANIGVFAYNALKYGAKQVISYEPEPENFQVLSKQKLGNAILNNVAMAGEVGTIDFYITRRKAGTKPCMGTHSIIPVRGRDKITVPTLSFYDELKKYKPTILKMDTEGGEYTIDWTKLPKYIKYLAIEIHCRKKEEESRELLKWFEDNFDVLYNRDLKRFGNTEAFVRMGKRI